LLPEATLREWLNRIVPSAAEELVQEAQQLEEADPAAAEVRYREALASAPDLAPATIGLARLLESQRRFDEARELIDQLERRGFLEPEAERVKSALAVEEVAAASGGVETARAAVLADPGNLSLKIPLAEALAADGQYADALELCLEVITADKTSSGIEAKEAMLNILNLTDDPELAAAYRRRLATALY
jgi:putative thioredoxin